MKNVLGLLAALLIVFGIPTAFTHVRVGFLMIGIGVILLAGLLVERLSVWGQGTGQVPWLKIALVIVLLAITLLANLASKSS